MKRKVKTIILCSVIFMVAAISALGIWFLTSNRAVTGSGNVLNVSWYDENGTEFTITTVEELYEFAELSYYYDFQGQTIKLGADIVVNEGNVEDWVDTYAENMWTPIEGFAGTFDGQGHSISGICAKDYGYGIDQAKVVPLSLGFFVETQKDCVIKDFKLLNSYFCSDVSGGTGSIIGSGVGTLENIYSDAVVVGYSECVGGIVGMISGTGSAIVTNCWFDGEVRIDGNAGRYTGGIVGRVAPTNGQNKIEHCLNTSNVSSKVTGKGVNMAGIIGNVQDSARVNLTDCLNVGQITNDYGAAVGSVIGSVEVNASVNIDDVYTKTSNYRAIIGNVSGTIIGAPIGNSDEKLIGEESVRWTTLNYDEYWAVVEDGTPILQSFADEVPSVDGIKKAYDTSWYDKTKSEFTITTLEQFYGLSYLSAETNFAEKTIKLGADLVVNEGTVTDWLNGSQTNEWLTIGHYGYPFAGTFDGQMHTISGIYLNEGRSGFGIFGATKDTAIVENLILKNSYIYAEGSSIGSIAGTGSGTFNTVYSNAVVIGASGNVGGLIGSTGNTGVTMTNCWFDGSVTGTGNTKAKRITGGLVGIINGGSSINNCLNTGTVDATAYTFNQGSEDNKLIVPVVGGLVGNVAAGKNLTLKESLNVGEVKTSDVANTGYGALVGYVNGQAEATYVYATAESCKKMYAGNAIKGSFISTGKSSISGYKGYQWTLLNFENYWSVVMNDTPILKSFAKSNPSISGIARMIDVSWYDEKEDTYILYDAADLNGLALLASGNNFKGKAVKLGKDIVLNTGNASTWGKNAPSNPWTAIGSKDVPFAGTFDGCMHTISGLYMKTNAWNSGLFGRIGVDGIVKNLKLTNSYLESSSTDFGSIAGVLQGTLDTVYSDAIVVGALQRTGGLIGHTSNADVVIRNSWFDGSVTNVGISTAARQNGGLVGCIYSGSATISNCLNTGTITSMVEGWLPVVGGLIGEVLKDSTLKMDGCLNTGKIVYCEEATTGFGPIVGWNNGTNNVTLTTTYATEESCSSFNRSAVTGISKITTDNLIGYLGYQWTLLDFSKYWAVVLDGTPILQSFAKEVPSLAGVEHMLDTSWYDTKKDTYILYDAADLNGFAALSASTNFAGKTVKLGKDIVINKGDAKTWGENAPSVLWSPIGSKDVPFAGTFDGCMYSISGLYMNSDTWNSGLFGRIAENGIVKNVKLTNSYLQCSSTDFGSIAGVLQGTLDTVYSDAIVVGSLQRTGGLVGHTSADDVTIKNCWFAGRLTNVGTSTAARQNGGLIGCVYSGSVELSNCLNTGMVTSMVEGWLPVVGGLIGEVQRETELEMEGCLNVGKVTCSEEATSGYGPIVGWNNGTNNTTLVSIYATAESCSSFNKSAVNEITKVTTAEITGYLGYQWTLLDFDRYWAVATEGTPVLKSFAKEIPSLAGVQKMLDISWYDEDASTYTLSDVADLYGFALLFDETAGYKGKTIKLGADIVVNEGNASDWATEAPAYAWTPVGYRDGSGVFHNFEGTFDGQMHSISGLYMKTGTRFAGLFGVTGKNATVKNLKILNSYFESSQPDFGCIAGLGNGTFDTIYSNAIVVSSSARAAGMVGQINDTTLINKCWFDGNFKSTIASGSAYGGLVGSIYTGVTTMTDCLNTGVIDIAICIDPHAGGLVGDVGSGSSLNISNCFNAGSVSNTIATANIGPVIGVNSGKGTLTNLYATTESCTNNKSNVTVTTYAKATLRGNSAENKLTTFDFANIWATVDYATPVLKDFKKMAIDITWYDIDKDEFILYDRADLYGFASLVNAGNSFANKTVKLGADIVINTGNASDWAKDSVPTYTWTPIGTVGQNRWYYDTFDDYSPFSGTFDGQNHTISGIYINENVTYKALFGATSGTAVVKNFKLVNSYISGNAMAASIASAGNGTFENIYSNAIINSTSSCSGGIIGRCDVSAITIKNCWFDGTLTTSRGGGVATGGIIGRITVSGSRIENCLNTGTVTASGATSYLGGLIGQVNATTVTIMDCLSVGKVTASSGQGAIIGTVDTGKTAIVTDTYAASSACANVIGGGSIVDASGTTITDTASMQVAESEITGTKAVDKLTGLDFGNTWITVENGSPILKVFQ